MEETIVSLIPQANGLRAILNISFQDLQDARQTARDITNIGHWSTGNADLQITPKTDLTYAMGLIRQVFEWQREAVEP